MPNGNLFDSVEPHRHLPPDARVALWSACQLVQARPDDFKEATTWLKQEYSKASQRKKCEKKYRQDFARRLKLLRRNGTGIISLSTYRRRLAIQRGARWEQLAWETIDEALYRGLRWTGEALVGRPRKHWDGTAAVDETNVDAVWRAEDERYRQLFRRIKAERRSAKLSEHDHPDDRAWRLERAVRDAMKDDLPAGDEQARHACRVVLLACLLSWPHPLPLADEFGAWAWNDKGGPWQKTYVAGRITVLFGHHPFSQDKKNHETFGACGGIALSAFTDLVVRAVNILAEASPPPAQDAAGTKAGKAKGGRPRVPKTEAKRRKALIEAWQRAKEAGIPMKDFCEDRECDLKYLEKCLNWASQQSRRNTFA